MTRPMPEPLECTCLSRGNFCWTCVDTIGWDLEEECPSCPVHAGPTYSEAKRLTDAECAAEFWRAEAEEADARGRSWFYEDPATVNAERVKASLAANRARTWHRFATLPHALEVTP